MARRAGRAGELHRRAADRGRVRLRALPPDRHAHRPGGAAEPDRAGLDVHALVYAEFADGRFLRVRAFYDVYRAAMALGVLPKHGTAGERALLMLRGFGLRG